MTRVGAVLLLVCALSASTAASGGERRPVTSTVAVRSLEDGAAVPGTRAVLRREAHGLSVRVNARGLEPGEQLDLFWATFDRPAACVHGNPVTGSPCGPRDLAIAEAGPSLQLVGTVTADAAGRVRYTDSLVVGDTSRCVAAALCGAGLQAPFDAEVHSVLFNGDRGRVAAQFVP